MMNDQDAFAQLVLQPHSRVTLRWDMLHWLRASSSRDLTYFGGGATSNSSGRKGTKTLSPTLSTSFFIFGLSPRIMIRYWLKRFSGSFFLHQNPPD
jgi:hypothetical protein